MSTDETDLLSCSISIPGHFYSTGHRTFAQLGETFLVVHFSGIFLTTDNAETTRQITARREDFPKNTSIYSILGQFGRNVLTTEGAVWRTHRRVTSTTFNEKNAAVVFREAIRQAQGLLQTWTASNSDGRKTLRSLEFDTMRLALNIIGYVGFGIRLLWPGQTLPVGTDPQLAKYASLDAPEGHTLSFVETIATLLDNLMILLLVPSWLLGTSCHAND